MHTHKHTHRHTYAHRSVSDNTHRFTYPLPPPHPPTTHAIMSCAQGTCDRARTDCSSDGWEVTIAWKHGFAMHFGQFSLSLAALIKALSVSEVVVSWLFLCTKLVKFTALTG